MEGVTDVEEAEKVGQRLLEIGLLSEIQGMECIISNIIINSLYFYRL